MIKLLSKMIKNPRKLVCILLSVWLLYRVYHINMRYIIQRMGGYYTGNDIRTTDEEVNAVVQLINESNTGSPMSEHLQGSGRIMDNLCVLHYGHATQQHLQKNGIKTTKLSEDEITWKCRRRNRTNDVKSVPNRVFYVIYGQLSFTYLNYLSFLSVHKFVRPEALYLVGDVIPSGEYWGAVMGEVPYVKFVYWPRPLTIYGNTIPGDMFASDVVRLQIYLTDGGIYLDTDLFILRPLTPLAHHPVTMGLIDGSTGVGNGFVMAQPASHFLRLWYMSYKNYGRGEQYFGLHSMQIPLKLWQMYPDLINVEEKSIYQPSWKPESKKLLFEGQYDWSKNYAIHVWKNQKLYPIPHNITDIWAKNTTIAQIIRHIVYARDDS